MTAKYNRDKLHIRENWPPFTFRTGSQRIGSQFYAMNGVQDRKQKRETKDQKILVSGNGDLGPKKDVVPAGSASSENIFLFYPNIIGMSSPPWFA